MGVVLAVTAGVLGMHVLTAGHGAHGVGAQASDSGVHGGDPAPAAGVPGDDLAAGGGHRHGDDSASTPDHVGDQASTTTATSLTAWSWPGGTAARDVGPLAVTHVVEAAPACDTGCGAGMGSVCLAVILLALLLLRRHAWVSGSRHEGQVGLAHLVRSVGVGRPRPSLVQLCVSRI